jgi:hypothetical protein
LPNDPSLDQSPLKNEIASLILRFGKPAVIEELARISREGRRRGPKPQKDYSNLIDMARIIDHAEFTVKKDFPIGRAARIIADRQNCKPGKERDATIKRLKRKFGPSRALLMFYLKLSAFKELLLKVHSQWSAGTISEAISEEMLIEHLRQATQILRDANDLFERLLLR